jgi:hypothetical protein
VQLVVAQQELAVLVFRWLKVLALAFLMLVEWALVLLHVALHVSLALQLVRH